jgi:hypothetical protein
MPRQVHTARGTAVYEHACKKSRVDSHQTIGWDPGYPAFDAPVCAACRLPFERVSGDDPAADLAKAPKGE